MTAVVVPVSMLQGWRVCWKGVESRRAFKTYETAKFVLSKLQEGRMEITMNGQLRTVKGGR